MAFERDIYNIYDIEEISNLLFDDLYEDAKNLNLIPFVSSDGQLECYIGGGEENLGDIYFLDDSAYIDEAILICKGFDTFMSAYKKREEIE